MERAALVCLLIASARAGQECQAKFGEPYELSGAEGEEPALVGGQLELTVSYESPCAEGGSSWSTNWVHKEELGMRVVFANRSSPSCGGGGGATRRFTGRVLVDLPRDLPDPEASFVAFPEGGEYDIFKLAPRAGGGAPAFLAAAGAAPFASEAADDGAEHEPTDEEKAEKMAELATQTEEDSRNHLAACEAQAEGLETPTSCCCPWVVGQLKLKLAEHEAAAARGEANASAAPAELAFEGTKPADLGFAAAGFS